MPNMSHSFLVNHEAKRGSLSLMILEGSPWEGNMRLAYMTSWYSRGQWLWEWSWILEILGVSWWSPVQLSRKEVLQASGRLGSMQLEWDSCLLCGACKGVHSLMPDLGHVVDSDRLVCLCPGFHPRYKRARWDERIERRRNELCSDWRTPSWRLGVCTNILLIHFARGHIGLCYCTSS